jgi:hypothetical protein
MAEASALLTQAKAQVTANRARVPRRTLREAQQALARADDDVQKARAAMKADDYDAAQPVLQGLKERIEKVLAAIDAAATQSTRRAR